MAVQIQPLIKRPEQDNNFLAKTAPLIGGLAGAALGSIVPGAGTAAGAAAGSSLALGAGTATGASLGMGLGQGIGGFLQKPMEQASQTPTIGVGGGAMDRRLDSLRQGTDSNLSALKNAALALPQMPPEVRQEAAPPIMQALFKDAYGNQRKV